MQDARYNGRRRARGQAGGDVGANTPASNLMQHAGEDVDLRETSAAGELGGVKDAV